MRKHYYNAGSLERELREFEQEYGLSSEAFYKAHCADKAPRKIPSFDRVVWADLYRQVCQMRGQDSRPAV